MMKNKVKSPIKYLLYFENKEESAPSSLDITIGAPLKKYIVENRYATARDEKISFSFVGFLSDKERLIVVLPKFYYQEFKETGEDETNFILKRSKFLLDI